MGREKKRLLQVLSTRLQNLYRKEVQGKIRIYKGGRRSKSCLIDCFNEDTPNFIMEVQQRLKLGKPRRHEKPDINIKIGEWRPYVKDGMLFPNFFGTPPPDLSKVLIKERETFMYPEAVVRIETRVEPEIADWRAVMSKGFIPKPDAIFSFVCPYCKVNYPTNQEAISCRNNCFWRIYGKSHNKEESSERTS